MQLHIHEEGDEPRVIRVAGPEVSIGRHPDSDVVLTQSFVSGHHARIFAGVLVQDVGSHNGTFVRGERIERPALLDGDPFFVGGKSLSITVELVDQDGMAPLLRDALRDALSAAAIDDRASPVTPSDESSLLRSLVRDDFDGVEIPDDSSATDLYLYEAFRFIRSAERVISKVAGSLTRELSHKTLLPDADKNFRAHMAELFVQRHHPAIRAELHDYLNTVFEWLYAAVHCYQKAALGVVQELHEELSPAALLRSRPVSPLKRLAGGEKAALWERAEERLEVWNPTHVIDRLEAQVSAAAKAFRLAADFDDL